MGSEGIDQMNSILKKILSSPFNLLNKIKFRKISLLWRISDIVLKDEDKIRLSRKAQFRSIIEKGPDKSMMMLPFLNALEQDNGLAMKFSSNLFENFHLYESQLGQDCIVDTLFDHKTNGIFVEIGVGEGKKISNTYFLEKYRNWTGILCEPSIKFHDSIQNTRRAQLVTEAVYDKSGIQLDFMEVSGDEELSTLSSFRNKDSHKRDSIKEYKVRTISFNDLYEKYLGNQKIDYLSIDTEGSELVILSAIDFKKINISVISVEHNYDRAKLDNISLLLKQHDYKEILKGVFEFDAIFCKKII